MDTVSCCYHATCIFEYRKLRDRESIQESFCIRQPEVVVANVAFGIVVDAQGVKRR